MSETQLTDAEANALHGTTDSETDFKYHSPGDAGYFTEGQRQRHRVLTLVKAVANNLRVYSDGALTFGLRAGSASDGEEAYAYAGSASNALTDDATNYIYLDLDAGDLRLVCNTTGRPDASATPHIPLATITAADGGYGFDDITDLRAAGVFQLGSAMSAAGANTLVGGSASNADALHVHSLAGLADAVVGLMPQLGLAGTDDADGTGSMAIQVKDAAGNDLAGRFRVRCWLSTSDCGAPAAEFDFSVNTGTLLREIAANADYEVISDATGLVEMNIDPYADGACYVMAEVDGRVFSGSVTITGN